MALFTARELEIVRRPPSLVPRCGVCRLDRGCSSPKMPVYGEGRRGVLVVGEAPGETEDRQNRPLVGKAGQRLRTILRGLGVDLDRDCWTTNALICRPPGNEIPDPRMVDYCRPNVIKTIGELNPSTIVLLGGVAVRSVVSWLWGEDTGVDSMKGRKGKRGKDDPVRRWVGWRIPSQQLNAWVCPTYHPSFVERALDSRDPVPQLLVTEHLRAAFALEGRPWAEVPDYQSQVTVETNPDTAADIIYEMMYRKAIAFDYETDRLKPDNSDSRIVCCSMSDGDYTIAYPWAGKAITATAAVLKSNVPKIASNMKFEDRWTRAKLGFHVRNWAWDTMLAAHVLDNRPGISGLKFQAFVLLGQGEYDKSVKPYLKSDGDSANSRNRVTECPLEDLLLYCGVDSLLEVLVAKKQRRMMK
jgi:uracil-DNA glycosylase family 4